MDLAVERFTELATETAVAALPMYDLPELRDANDTLWAAIRRGLKARGVGEAPQILTRSTDLYGVWSNPDLLIAQTCGYPLVSRLLPHVRLLLTPRYRAAGCEGPFHRAAIVVRRGFRAENLSDLRGHTLALNDWDSNTGMNLLRTEVAQVARGARWFSQVRVTGSHVESALAVAEGQADVASLDCITWALLQRLRPALTVDLRVLLWSARSPGLPFITSAHTDAQTVAALRDVLTELGDDPQVRAARRELLLEEFHELSNRHYFVLRYFERLAADLNYEKLH